MSILKCPLSNIHPPALHADPLPLRKPPLPLQSPPRPSHFLPVFLLIPYRHLVTRASITASSNPPQQTDPPSSSASSRPSAPPALASSTLPGRATRSTYRDRPDSTLPSDRGICRLHHRTAGDPGGSVRVRQSGLSWMRARGDIGLL